MKITEAIAHLREAERKATKGASDREATQDFAVRTVLIHHCGKMLSPDLIEQIGREINAEMRTGPCSWAFRAIAPQALALIEAQAAEIEAWRAWNNSENPDAGILQVEDTGARTDAASAAFAEAVAAAGGGR